MTTPIPDNCIKCEQVYGGRLRNPDFVMAIKEKATATGKSFSQVVREYMKAFHNWDHVA